MPLTIVNSVSYSTYCDTAHLNPYWPPFLKKKKRKRDTCYVDPLFERDM